MKSRKKILVMAYAISPSRGSEYAVAWNYVKYMSRENDLTVLYGTSDSNMGDIHTLEEYLCLHDMPHVRFIAIKPNKWVNLLNWPNLHNVFAYAFYYAFVEWHKQAYVRAKELINQEHFDLIHFVGPIGYREPGFLWKLKLPYVWGPIGGANNVPLPLMKNMPFNGKVKLMFRNLANTIQFHTMRRLKRALRHTDVLLTATSENQRKFFQTYHINSICIPENCIEGEIQLDLSKFKDPSKYRFIVVGRLDAGKAIGIFLEALTYVRCKKMLEVDIVGDGPLRHKLEKYTQQKGISNIIKWHGQLPRNKAVELFNNAHMHVITSTSEGNPTTIWEAMSHGVPTISFDHCGMHDTICERCGIRIPIHSYEQCVYDLAKEIDGLLENPERFEQLAHGVVECAQKYTWADREKFLLKCYDMAINNYKHKHHA